MSAGSDGNEGGRGRVKKPHPFFVASVSFSAAPVDRTAPLSWALGEVTVFHLCSCPPAVVNASLTLFYLLSLSKTLNARTSSGSLP